MKANETESVKVSKPILNKVRKHVQKTKQTIGGFYDLAAEEKIRNDKKDNQLNN
jgi:hypothetical protein